MGPAKLVPWGCYTDWLLAQAIGARLLEPAPKHETHISATRIPSRSLSQGKSSVAQLLSGVCGIIIHLCVLGAPKSETLASHAQCHAC